MTQTQSPEWCSMVLDGHDTNGDEWNRCTVHDHLVFGDAYVCEGYEAPPYVDPRGRRVTQTQTFITNGVTVERIDNGHTLTIRRTGSLPCGCTPHTTQMTPMGFHCVTEQQGYCNFECPHDEEDK